MPPRRQPSSAAGTVAAANLAGAALLGLERSRLVGRSFASFVPPGERPAFGRFLERVLAGGARQELELGLVPSGEPADALYVRLQAVAEEGGAEGPGHAGVPGAGRGFVAESIARRLSGAAPL